MAAQRGKVHMTTIGLRVGDFLEEARAVLMSAVSNWQMAFASKGRLTPPTYQPSAQDLRRALELPPQMREKGLSLDSPVLACGAVKGRAIELMQTLYGGEAARENVVVMLALCLQGRPSEHGEMSEHCVKLLVFYHRLNMKYQLVVRVGGSREKEDLVYLTKVTKPTLRRRPLTVEIGGYRSTLNAN